MDKLELRGAVMAVLFVAGEAMDISVLSRLLNVMPDSLETAVQEMVEEMERREDGILLLRVGSGVQLATNKKYAPYIKEAFTPEDRVALSASAIETLSVIAYRQPVTRAEIDSIRGVNSNYAVSSLIDKGLVMVAGRKDVLGRPALLVTTDEFLRHFGISSLEELPQVDFEALEEEATESREEV